MSERGRAALDLVGRLEALGVPCWLAARAVGVHEGTLGRWVRRARAGRPLRGRRGPRAAVVNAEAEAQAADLVRALGGQVGAESLRRSVPGLSRRRAGAVKKAVCRDLERERRRAAQRITVSGPGVLRGLDGMDLGKGDSLLVSADGAVPYRTSWAMVRRYDGAAVAALVERDIALNGSPLVYRMDRARQHETASVREVLARHQVLLLHGPPRRPQYYGQLERQNREHRAWLGVAGRPALARSADQIGAMMCALNGLWRRRTLGWRTASEVWQARSVVHVDRTELAQEIAREVESLREKPALRGRPADLGERLAIEHALARRGLLRREYGGWC
jgi:transposase-like protein